MQKRERITVRLTAYQMQCLKELKESLGTSYSLLTRSIIGNFLCQNEDALERIIEKKSKEDADNQFGSEEDQE